MDAAVVGIVVLEDVALVEAGQVLVTQIDEVLDHVCEKTRMRRDPSRDADRLPGGQVERP